MQFIAVFPTIIYIDQWGEPCLVYNVAVAHPDSREATVIERCGHAVHTHFLVTTDHTPSGGSAVMGCSHLVIALLVRGLYPFSLTFNWMTIDRSTNLRAIGLLIRRRPGLRWCRFLFSFSPFIVIKYFFLPVPFTSLLQHTGCHSDPLDGFFQVRYSHSR